MGIEAGQEVRSMKLDKTQTSIYQSPNQLPNLNPSSNFSIIHNLSTFSNNLLDIYSILVYSI